MKSVVQLDVNYYFKKKHSKRIKFEQICWLLCTVQNGTTPPLIKTCLKDPMSKLNWSAGTSHVTNLKFFHTLFDIK